MRGRINVAGENTWKKVFDATNNTNLPRPISESHNMVYFLEVEIMNNTIFKGGGEIPNTKRITNQQKEELIIMPSVKIL